MYKTENINIAGRAFIINQDAFEKLSDYLNQLKNHFSSQDELEIVEDIEIRISEILLKKLDEDKIEVVNLKMIESVIETLGTPADFGIEEDTFTKKTEEPIKKKFFRDIDDAAIGGVCIGIANYFDINPSWVRVGFVLSFLFGGSGLFIYLVLWAVIPAAFTTEDKFRMKGKRANISNIEQKIREEAERVNKNFSKAANQMDKTFTKKTRQATQNIGSLFKRVFRLIHSLVGAFLIFLSLSGLAGLSGLLFNPPAEWEVDVFDHNWEGGKIFMLFEQIFENPDLLEWSYMGALSLVLIPLITFMMVGINLLFNIKTKFKHWGSALFLMFLFGASSIIYTSIHVSKQFSSRIEIEESISLENSSNYRVELISDNFDLYPELFNEPYFNPLKIEYGENFIHYGHSRMEVFPSDTDSSYIVIYRASNGHNNRQAEAYAKQMKFDIRPDSNNIIVKPGFDTSPKDPFRAQELNYYLYLKEGASITFPQNGDRLFHDVPNSEDILDEEMWGQTFIMTNGELSPKK